MTKKKKKKDESWCKASNWVSTHIIIIYDFTYNAKSAMLCTIKMAEHKSECKTHAPHWCDLNKPNIASGSGLKWVTRYFHLFLLYSI